MKPPFNVDLIVRYRTPDDPEPVTLIGPLVRIEGGKHLGFRVSTRKIRWIHANWIMDWKPATTRDKTSPIR